MLKREAVTSECLRMGDFQVLALALLSVDDKTVQAVRIEEEKAGTIQVVTVFRCKDGKKRRYNKSARQQKVSADVKQQEAPVVLTNSTTSDEPQQDVPPADSIVLPVQTSESDLATMPLDTAARTSFEEFLGARMAAHGIQGTVSALLALLAELGVDPKKFQAA